MTQEEEHGRVKVGISPDHQQQHQVPRQCQEVDLQEQHKEQSLDVWVSRQPEEEELSDDAVVPQSHLHRLFPRNDIKRHDSKVLILPNDFLKAFILFLYHYCSINICPLLDLGIWNIKIIKGWFQLLKWSQSME